MREGGCLCAAVRYRAEGKPSRTVVCHCKFCQRCTGSAFAVWATYGKGEVVFTAAFASYEHRSDASGRWIKLHFCPRCGTSVASSFEKGPGEIALLAGTFDDTGWISVERHVWTRSRQHWFSLPADAVVFEKSSSA